jgi:hypothetical protein
VKGLEEAKVIITLSRSVVKYLPFWFDGIAEFLFHRKNNQAATKIRIFHFVQIRVNSLSFGKD